VHLFAEVPVWLRSHEPAVKRPNTAGFFQGLGMSLSALLEQSFAIAWDYLEATGELENREVATRFLVDHIDTMIASGERRKLVLSNRAIDAYKQLTSKRLLLVS
jgi:hypothetical protein